MINIVLDTNVLVASLINNTGLNSQVLSYVFHNLNNFNIVVSSQISDEYKDVLHRSEIGFRGLRNEADGLRELVRQEAVEVIPKSLDFLRYPDIKDKPFLEVAVYVDGILITNNIKDFPFLGVRIMQPGEFLQAVEAFGWGEN